MKEWKEWIVEECPALTLDGKILSTMLRREQELIRCKDCRWYDEKISFCDNCNLPREQTFFCADGEART